ncbi:MAG: hypothetical protein KGD57_04215 [Candidatus Lokiarchaeota archaeon]|nr:hypothetical protein [Candidatus Lokiarchaeota archaeon]
MIKKEDLKKSLEFFKDITLDDKDYDVIFNKFKLILNTSEFEDQIKQNLSYQNKKNGNEDIQRILEELIEILNIKDMNLFLQKIIRDEKLTVFIQDFFLEKLL